MPLSWTSEQERKLLLIAIIVADLKPISRTWHVAAHALGKDVTISAVRYDYMVLTMDHHFMSIHGICPADHSILPFSNCEHINPTETVLGGEMRILTFSQSEILQAQK